MQQFVILLVLHKTSFVSGLSLVSDLYESAIYFEFNAIRNTAIHIEVTAHIHECVTGDHRYVFHVKVAFTQKWLS